MNTTPLPAVVMVDLVSGRSVSGHRTVDARSAFRKRFLHIDGRTRLPKMARTRRELSIHGQRRILRASRSHSPAISHSARKSLPLLEILLHSHDHAFSSRLASQKSGLRRPQPKMLREIMENLTLHIHQQPDYHQSLLLIFILSPLMFQL